MAQGGELRLVINSKVKKAFDGELQKLTAYFRAFEKRALPVTQDLVVSEVIRKLDYWKELSFKFEESPEGIAWDELADRTQDERESEGYPPDHPILQRTKSYRFSFGPISGSTSSGSVSVEYGSTDPRAAILEFGGPNETGAIVPPRPVLGPTADQIESINYIFEKIIGELIETFEGYTIEDYIRRYGSRIKPAGSAQRAIRIPSIYLW